LGGYAESTYKSHLISFEESVNAQNYIEKLEEYQISGSLIWVDDMKRGKKQMSNSKYVIHPIYTNSP
jgi:hypothetical protein